MPYQFNIFNFKVNTVSANGNVTFGAGLQNSHTANAKLIGVNQSFGDIAPASAVLFNNTIDPDVSDQDQIANPSAPVANQI
ncbi:spore germination protein [Paenibacillus hamazuiensis]|uniref:spore germination protein n=1 Tax=Paenibacillus hamazuiensis TaxID=2936508 RepID=UPI00200C390F|nr:spore germination protein [Paenibacillus hamazuiensis]